LSFLFISDPDPAGMIISDLDRQKVTDPAGSGSTTLIISQPKFRNDEKQLKTIPSKISFKKIIKKNICVAQIWQTISYKLLHFLTK
jgi:hypothetical protein